MAKTFFQSTHILKVFLKNRRLAETDLSQVKANGFESFRDQEFETLDVDKKVDLDLFCWNEIVFFLKDLVSLVDVLFQVLFRVLKLVHKSGN